MQRRSQHFWIDLIVLVTGIACGLALLIATLGAAAGAVEDGSSLATQSSQSPTAPLPAQAASPSPAVHPTWPSPEGQPTNVAQQIVSEQTFEGFVTCTQCGAKHAAKIGKSAADCTRMCVHGGSKFALVDGEKTYMLDGDLAQLKRVAGQRAQIVGAMKGNTIWVSSIISTT